MGLLDQLFRHKDDLPGADSASPVQLDHAAGPFVKRDARSSARGVGAIAAAVGIQPGRAMPVDFEITLGDILPRTPEMLLHSGTHDAGRVLRVPISEVTEGLAKGRAEIPLARLATLAPDVFLPAASDAESPRIRLPLQKLLQQIGTSVSARGGESAAGIPLFAAPAAHLQATLVAEKSDAERSRGVESKGAQSPASIALAAAIAHESHPPLHASVTEPMQKPLELRPHTGVATSTTLRAVILGGKTLASQGEGAAAANQILAPVATATSGSPASVSMAPVGRAAVTPAKSSETPSIAWDREGSTRASSGNALEKPVDFAALQRLFMTDATLDLAAVAAKVAALPGVHACTISNAAESAQAGHFPSGLDANALRAIVVDPRNNAGERVTRLNFGAVATTTLVCGDRSVGIFHRDKTSLAVVIDARGFVAGVRERIASVTDCLAGGSCTD